MQKRESDFALRLIKTNDQHQKLYFLQRQHHGIPCLSHLQAMYEPYTGRSTSYL